MVTKIQKWGNSQGIRISREILKRAHLDVGENVDIESCNGRIVIKPVAVKRGKYRLDKMLSGMPDNFRPGETGWGKAEGRELP